MLFEVDPVHSISLVPYVNGNGTLSSIHTGIHTTPHTRVTKSHNPTTTCLQAYIICIIFASWGGIYMVFLVSSPTVYI